MSDANPSADTAALANQDVAAAAAAAAGAGGGALLELSMIASNAHNRRETAELRQQVGDSTLALGLRLEDLGHGLEDLGHELEAGNDRRDDLLLQSALIGAQGSRSLEHLGNKFGEMIDLMETLVAQVRAGEAETATLRQTLQEVRDEKNVLAVDLLAVRAKANRLEEEIKELRAAFAAGATTVGADADAHGE